MCGNVEMSTYMVVIVIDVQVFGVEEETGLVRVVGPHVHLMAT